MLENKNVLKIISLIIAILLWVYVMGEVNPDTKEKISDIEVTFVNTETLADEGLAVVHEQDLRVSAIVKGKRSVINEMKKSSNCRLELHLTVSQTIRSPIELRRV